MNQSERDRYVKAWGDRRARLFMLAAMIAGFCASVALWANAWLAAAFFFAGATIGAWGWHEFPCPRCHRRFSWKRERCQHCGLAKNAGPDGTD